MEFSNYRKIFLLHFSLALLLRLISAFTPNPTPVSDRTPVEVSVSVSPPAPAPAWPPYTDPWDDGNDYYDYTSGPPPPPPAPCNPKDRETLLRIKKALNDSVILSSWIPDTDCCNRWEYVGCDETTGRVINLVFYGNGWGRDDLPRILPKAVGDLTYLSSLVFYNNVTGPVPRALSKLQNLGSLYLSHNQFTGRIPSFFSRMKYLSWLELSGNKLIGRIPSSLSNATNLMVLKLDNNRLTGKIPDSLGKLKPKDNNVITIDLSYNRLSGFIPRSFGGVNFRRLFLSGNKLKGDASFVFGKNKGVWQIDLSGNSLSFNMSNIEIPPQLSWLGLSHNRIFGSLPTALANVGIMYLNVSYNQLCGQIPQGGNLQQFDETSYFHNKCLCGSPLSPCKN